jgi:hypothetical protein
MHQHRILNNSWNEEFVSVVKVDVESVKHNGLG